MSCLMWFGFMTLTKSEQWFCEVILMNIPKLSPDFTTEDIRKLRDYNSQRHVSMSLEEIQEDLRPSVGEFNRLMAERKRPAAVHSSS